MANPKTGRTPTDKERSKQMSRPVATGNQAGRGDGRTNGRQGQGSGGPRRSNSRGSGGPPNRGSGTGRSAGSRPAPRGPAKRSPTALLTWGTAALVLVIVIILVVVKIAGGTGNHNGPPWTPVTPAVAAEVTGVPASVFNTVGINSAIAAINPPIAITGQPPLTYPVPAGGSAGSSGTSGATRLPGVYFYGAEYCPYCAAARWSIIVAFSRFGTFHNLGNMQSSASDVFANTPTFTFSRAKYTSPYFVFEPDEYFSNQVTASGSYSILKPPTKAQEKLVVTYDSAKYFPSSLSQGANGFPFIDFGNKILADTLYNPGVLQGPGITREVIASGLTDPKNPITDVIVSAANYLSASLCNIDGQQPSSVCTSKGVMAAAKAMKLS